MELRYRLLGVVIVICGLGAAYGAVVLWPPGLLEAPLWSWATAIGVLRIAAAGVAAALGVGNVLAGLAVAFHPPVRT